MISDSVKTALDAIGITNLFARVGEANFGLDKLPATDYPVAIFILPESQTSTWGISGQALRTVTIDVMFLDRVPNELDPTTELAYPKIDDMVTQSERFWLNLQNDEVVRLVNTVEHVTLWAAFDSQLYGVMSTAEVEYFSTATC